MQIYGPYRVSTAQPNSASQRSQPVKPAEPAPGQQSAPVDQLDLSSTSRLEAPSNVSVGGDIRIELVANIRRQIADGTYETPEKLDKALDRLLDRFA